MYCEMDELNPRRTVQPTLLYYRNNETKNTGFDMPDYRRIWAPGGTYFFTLVTYQRRPIFMDETSRQILKQAFAEGIKKAGEFKTIAFCLLPDHLHCIWSLPENDSNFAMRWKIIKAWFSHQYRKQGGISGSLTTSGIKKGEAGIWQRRYWEHLIRDENDLERHINYIHYNPVKHGLVQEVDAWPWSTFHKYVQQGFYATEWENDIASFGANNEFE